MVRGSCSKRGVLGAALVVLHLAVCFTATCEALYSEGTPVKVLDDKTIKKQLKKDGVYLVEFFAPWCGHCKNLKPEWEKVAKGLDGIVTVAAVDVDANKESASKYSVQSLPTIKAISISNGKVDFEESYEGERTAEKISAFALKSAKAAIDFRLGVKKQRKLKENKKKPSTSGAGAGAGGFYTNVKEVVDLTSSTFAKKVKASEEHWMVEFYAPWCGHCKNLKPAWISAAKKTKGEVNFGAVNCDDASNKAVCSEYDIKGFPTIKYFGPKGKAPIPYSGPRDAKALAEYATRRAKGKSEPKATPKTPPSSGGGFYTNVKEVVDLTSANFAEKVKASEEHWFVEFYAPWCGHCKNLKPAWISAAKELKGEVNFGAVNCDDASNRDLCSEYGVQGFPTLKYLEPNKEAAKYSGMRDAKTIIDFARTKYKKTIAVPAAEMTSQDMFEERCTGSESHPRKYHMCLVGFLPDILDTQASGRNAYIEMMNNVSRTHAGAPYSFLWVSAGSQPELEANFNIGGFGYPALAAYSPKKNAYASLKGGFSIQEIDNLIKDLRKGKIAVGAIKGDLAKIKTVAAWDGKDASVQVEEEFSLEDIMGSDEEERKEEL
eukprot:CAMPEP_0197471920 /NCGR_PEP_ID=MMETSP1309-20131121/2979_1 /TAXON_ID=464262 /ORGANISM="Genus nov. species nov., Strain RCC998" /LENGTH=603 /DNA_ID=CAMNT_0043010047 /DNA_START=142 /DNA_END=1953 /DNA_ORIENTATION=+